MITPSFGLTATERVLPRLALDFTTASLDPRVTFTRAGNTATVINSNGLIESVLADTPRFDYTLNTGGACKGLLIEEARTNLCLQSQDLTTTWLNTLPGCVTADAAISPDGTQNADQIVLTGGAFQYVYQDVTVVSGQVYTFSFYVKAATVGNTPFRAYPDLTGIAATNVTPTQSWVRQTITFTTVDTTARLAFAVPSTGAAVDVYIWGAQVEAGAFATSYIPTTTTALTRNADVAQMTGTNFSDWYNASEGSFVTRGATGATTSSFPISLYVSDGTTSNRMTMGYFNFNNFQVVNTNVAQCGLTTTTPATNVQTTSVAAYKADNFAASTNASNTVTDTAGALPTVNQLRFGATVTGGQAFNGPIQRFFYYPQRLTNAEVQAFSKG